jgi:hypothetical protein
MKSVFKKSVVACSFFLLAGVAQASESSLVCRFNADPKSRLSLGVDESTQSNEVVLLGINAGQPGGDIKSAILRKGSLSVHDNGPAVMSLTCELRK